MRFIVGLIIGVAATILITVDMDLAPLRDSAQQLVDRVALGPADTTGDDAQRNPEPSAPAPQSELPVATAAGDGDELVPGVDPVGADPVPIDVAARDRVQNDPADIVFLDQTPATPPPPDTFDPLTLPLGIDPEPETSVPDHAPVASPTLQPGSGEGVATIWTPFYSEISASGFASRLSLALNQPFEVARSDAGRYSVTFVHDSVEDRDRVLDEVEALTGYRAR